MPKAIDQAKLNDLKILDISNPPTMEIPRLEFPKMVYLHPKDKTQEHKYKVVDNDEELTAALKLGYQKKPHVAVAPVEVVDEGEYEVPAEAPKEAPKPVDPAKLNKAELLAHAEGLGVEVKPEMTKAEVLAALEAKAQQ
jgi:hypothetical protein